MLKFASAQRRKRKRVTMKDLQLFHPPHVCDLQLLIKHTWRNTNSHFSYFHEVILPMFSISSDHPYHSPPTHSTEDTVSPSCQGWIHSEVIKWLEVFKLLVSDRKLVLFWCLNTSCLSPLLAQSLLAVTHSWLCCYKKNHTKTILLCWRFGFRSVAICW